MKMHKQAACDAFTLEFTRYRIAQGGTGSTVRSQF